MADRYTAQHDKARDITIIFTGEDTLIPKGYIDLLAWFSTNDVMVAYHCCLQVINILPS